MTPHPLRSQAGLTYIATIIMVVILGIMLSQGAQYWTTRMQREREVELLFRGTQVRDALRIWYGFKPPSTDSNGRQTPASDGSLTGAVKRPPLSELKMLLSNPGQAGRARYLRPSNLVDPITGKEWAVVKDASQRIVGVASTSEKQPLKQANFPLDLDPQDFEGKKKYSEWQFIYNHYPKPGGGGYQKNLNPESPTPQGK
ncbi:type II secretion system pseudopilin TklG [Geomonas limicola]|uniref:Type II secretion system pseudopilin TklG n=1 Tax=Geomonas limicola TaxID=2740186 RepID=A0A6V8NGB4_9BACT|nr:type II secretion system protein [Geomonas limicola]GFO70009.1 type II secretion system pseudopilin TklG [Geomonas limicola]